MCLYLGSQKKKSQIKWLFGQQSSLYFFKKIPDYIVTR